MELQLTESSTGHRQLLHITLTPRWLDTHNWTGAVCRLGNALSSPLSPQLPTLRQEMLLVNCQPWKLLGIATARVQV